ncbi:phosphoribosylformylglycinamidine synthase subunit PurQ [Candidatus Gottesmanbacteria bacterium]|nr:phosphoribosylformylglycinamidine synthase subunit PurQ [Candidatus Gottesmanbacteria bacterium]
MTTIMKPKVLVFSGYGLNSEEETKFAFDWAGGSAHIVHINDLINKKFSLLDYQILAFPGGFAYGDDTGSGNAYALKVRNHLWAELLQFIQKDRLIIGICNGFQILVNLGLLPATQKYGTREVGLMHNKQARYVVRFVDLNVETHKTPWLKDIKSLSIPVANGEGRLSIPGDILRNLKKRDMIAFRYFKGEMSTYLDLPANPNGSVEDIAGLIDPTGKILGLMPHPERGMFFVQLPNWPLLKEQYKRQGRKIPKEGSGLKIFQNAIKYFS